MLKYTSTHLAEQAASQPNGPVHQSRGRLIRRHAPLYLPAGACRRRWASRHKWPDPQLRLQHQSPPITQLTPITPGGTRATQGNGHTIHTLPCKL